MWVDLKLEKHDWWFYSYPSATIFTSNSLNSPGLACFAQIGKNKFKCTLPTGMK